MITGGAAAYPIRDFLTRANVSFEYRDGEPGYPCLRYFAGKVADAMAAGDNKWVVEQVMDIEAPEMVRLVRKLVELAAAPA